jgi:hypothetical protein
MKERDHVHQHTEDSWCESADDKTPGWAFWDETGCCNTWWETEEEARQALKEYCDWLSNGPPDETGEPFDGPRESSERMAEARRYK